MIFYATFFVGCSALAITRCYVNTPANVIPQVKMFCVAAWRLLSSHTDTSCASRSLQVLGSLRTARTAGACYLADP